MDLDGDGVLEWNDSHMLLHNGSWVRYHGNQGLEWLALERAVEMCEAGGHSRDIPFQCTSWGLGQLMGFHYRKLGYSSAEDMGLKFFSGDEQLGAMVRFIACDAGMARAVRNKDWYDFAKRYNGSGQAAHYAGLIEHRYDQYV